MNRSSMGHHPLKSRAFLFLFLLWSIWFLNFTVRASFAPLLPLIEDEFAINHAKASSVFIFHSIGYSIAVFLSGFYSGRFGLKRTILCSLIICSGFLFLVSFIKAFPQFYFFGFIIGIATGFYLPSAISLITEYFVETDWGKSIAIHDTAAPLSIFGTPLIALFLLHFLNWRDVFQVFAALCFIIAVIFFYSAHEFAIKQTGANAGLKTLLCLPSLWKIVLIAGFAAGANMGVYFITPLYLTKELMLTMGSANTILGISRLSGIGVAILCGVLADKISLRKILLLLVSVSGLLTILVGVTPAKFIWLALLMQALLVTGIFPLLFVLIAKVFPRRLRSMATSATMISSSVLGGGIIPYLLGLAGDHVRFRFGISLLGICVALSCSFLVKEIRSASEASAEP